MSLQEDIRSLPWIASRPAGRPAWTINTPWLYLKKAFCVGDNVRFGRNFHIGLLTNVTSAEELTIGNDVYVGKFCTIHGTGRIGDGVLIGNRVGVGISRNPPSEAGGAGRGWPSPPTGGDAANRVDIGGDVWIGFGSIILSGVSVGHGAVVAAGSVVAGDVASYDIVRGNPARTVGRRYADDQIPPHEAALARLRLHL